MKRLHFGVAGATSVSVKVEWPSGATQNFTNVATNKLYRLTEGSANPAVVTPGGVPPFPPGGAPPYQCGKPTFNPAVDKGVFIWRDCPTGEWRMKTAAGGGTVTYRGSITSPSPYNKVTTVGTSTADKVDNKTDPKVISFQLNTGGASSDGINFIPRDFMDACLRVDAPAGTSIYYGPFRIRLAQPLDLNTRGTCSP